MMRDPTSALMALPPGRALLLALGSLTSAYLVASTLRKALQNRRLRKVVALRRAERDRSLRWAEQSAGQLPLERRKQIAAMDFDTLRGALRKGEVTPSEALRTYQWKALQAHARTNCITLFIKESEEWTAELERLSADPTYVRGPLFGLPVSLKECVPLKGYDTTRGYVGECFQPGPEDCVMVEHIRALGGVPFVQTNVPQSLLAYSCFNPVYGQTSHPDHPDRTPGGSSGGESALIGAGGSLLGIGGDVGGSIRFPCHFCGIAGIKPSHLRFSHRGIKGSVPGRPLINASDGPMAPQVHTCVEFLRMVWSDTFIHSRDPYCPPVNWNEELFRKGNKFKIGFYVDDGWFTPTPACQRAVLEAKQILEQNGHSVVPFHPPRIPDALSLFIGAVCVDGGRYLLEKLDADLCDPRYGATLRLYRLPFWMQSLLAALLRPLYPRLSHALLAMPRNTSELRQKYAGIEKYRYEYVEALRKEGIDALICPAAVVAAPHHAVPTRLFAGVSYTGVFNLLDFAAGTVPITRVEQDDEEALKNYPTSDPWYRTAKETMKGGVGLPVGVQVAAPPYREEVCLRIMQDIEDARRITNH